VNTSFENKVALVTGAASGRALRQRRLLQAYERLLKGDVRYRFVIDMASLKN
jgi:D-arabinose 1-dehydrogenase-like Zn-dependent alcohol dehydrogenase